MMEQKQPCPECGSADTTKNGGRRVRGGLKQRYHCKTCGRKFTGSLNPMDYPYPEKTKRN